jgi:hypothetical protein
MLQMVFLASFGKLSTTEGVHGVGSMTFGLVVQKVLDY